MVNSLVRLQMLARGVVRDGLIQFVFIKIQNTLHAFSEKGADAAVSVDATGRCLHMPPAPRTAVSFLGARHACIHQYAIAHVGADLFVAMPAAHRRS